MPCKKSLDPLTEESGSDEQDEGGRGEEEGGRDNAGSKLVCRYLPSRGNEVVVNDTARCSTFKLARGPLFSPRHAQPARLSTATWHLRSHHVCLIARPLNPLAATSAILTHWLPLSPSLRVTHARCITEEMACKAMQKTGCMASVILQRRECG